MVVYQGFIPPHRIALPQVTLCAATSINIKATLRALKYCLDQIAFADCMLFTDAEIRPEHPEIRVVPIRKLTSVADYSEFLLSGLVDRVETSHCLITQWDGHVVDASRWRPEFLEYDYIGAVWPHFQDGYDVGNGGFSLRSRRLMEACRDPGFEAAHPEDIAVGRINRKWLEEKGMRFASRVLADMFAAERRGNPRESFGYHGVFNMPTVLGVENFWDIYRELDNHSTVRHDFMGILTDMGRGSGGFGRVGKMLLDRFLFIKKDYK